MDHRLNGPLQTLRVALGLTATLAGLDKFLNLLADWPHYVSPLAAGLLPFSTDALMRIVGVVEFGVGMTILAISPRVGSYIASAWLLLVALNLAVAGYFDVAVRDIVMSIAAFAVARFAEVSDMEAMRETAAGNAPRRTVTA